MTKGQMIHASGSGGPSLDWEIDVPLVTNWIVLGGLAKVFAITAVVMAILLSLISVVTGEPERIPAMLVISMATAGGLFLLALLASLLVYGNRMRLHCRVDGAGAETVVVDRRTRAVAIISIILGVFGRRPILAGSGLLANANVRQHMPWKVVTSARFNTRARTVSLVRAGWGAPLILFCIPANYETVAERVRAEMARR